MLLLVILKDPLPKCLQNLKEKWVFLKSSWAQLWWLSLGQGQVETAVEGRAGYDSNVSKWYRALRFTVQEIAGSQKRTSLTHTKMCPTAFLLFSEKKTQYISTLSLFERSRGQWCLNFIEDRWKWLKKLLWIYCLRPLGNFTLGFCHIVNYSENAALNFQPEGRVKSLLSSFITSFIINQEKENKNCIN